MTEVNRGGTGELVSYPQYCTPVGIASDAVLQVKLPQGVKRWIALDLSKQSCWICQAIGKYLSDVDLYAAKTIDMLMRVQEERIEQL